MQLSIFVSSILLSAVLGQSDPGYPVKNPSISYWQIPPHPDVADHQSPKLPESADIVIIGSGMSGTSIAWHLLMDDNSTTTPTTKKAPPAPLRIAMLEARQACSGATGRNGGHIRPSSYEEYVDAKKVTTQDQAAKITKFRAGHVDALLRAAGRLPTEQARQAASVRPVDSLDVYFEEAPFAEAVAQWETLRREVPEVGDEWSVLAGDEARRVSLMPGAVGALTGTARVAGAIWGYRFVTNGLKMLLDAYPESLSLDTHTTATSVNALKNSTHNFEVTTDRGTILANHVVYATNSWSPHFVPVLGNALQGSLLSMSAQLGGAGLPKPGEWPAYHNNVSLPGGRAWSLFLRGGLDYIVQEPEHGEYMYGGGAGVSFPGEDDRDQYDDSGTPPSVVAAYLNGALPTYFGYQNWGAERTDFPADLHPDIWAGRTKRVWTGVEGFTTDALPLVGPLAEQFTQRPVKNPAAGQEWVSAGFNGEGMDYAWLSGKGLGQMIRNHMANATNEPLFEWFPTAFLPTEARLQKQNGTAARRRDVGRNGRRDLGEL
ncbi:FAD dependent oxidoreductase-domain-containing protein [Apiospora marii]|uniref:FAD dependent oxidoreductase-domain-containing protein n=1 Tax=Apiospora marii TaxID=335849 RepID=A0ABR1SDK0_9PEZI